MSTLIQRPLRGSRISSFYPIKVLPSLSSLDSAFQLQEYISLLIRLDVHDVDAIVSVPGKPEKEKEADSPPTEEKLEETLLGEKSVAVDEACWIYEQLRRLAQDLSHPLITMLQQECTRRSCPEMKAGEWLYLCVAHGNDGAMEQCCAIDYILHTLDSATALLNSPRAFPSRLQIPQTSHRHFSSLARRLGRIFAHAYFHHREAFEQAEAESSLYARFLALTSKFDLVPAEFLVIPPRLEGQGQEEANVREPRLLAAAVDVPREQKTILTRDDHNENQDEKGASPPGLGSESPRKQQGRNRTDTMVHSDMNIYNLVEEMARNEEEITRNEEEITRNEEEITRNEEEIARNEEEMARNEEAQSNEDEKPSSATADVPENFDQDHEQQRDLVVESLRLNFEGVEEEDAELSILQREGDEGEGETDTPVPGSVFESHDEDLSMGQTEQGVLVDLDDRESSIQTVAAVTEPEPDPPAPVVSLPPSAEEQKEAEPAVPEETTIPEAAVPEESVPEESVPVEEETGNASFDINDVSLGEMQAVEAAVLPQDDDNDSDEEIESQKQQPAIEAVAAGKKDAESLDVPTEVAPLSPTEADVTEAHGLSDADEIQK